VKRVAAVPERAWGVLAVVGVGALVVALAGASPTAVGRELFWGAFGSWAKLARVLTVWAPLTLCACGLLFSFRVGLWNIGVEGQVLLGAIGACGVLQGAPAAGAPGLWLPLAFGTAAVGGAAWAALAGVLRLRAGVNEIFGGLGLNFVAQGTALWLIFGPWRRPGVASMSGTLPLPRELWLETLPWGRVSLTALGLGALAVAVSWVLLHHTRVGLTFRAVGQNPAAAALFGVRSGNALVGSLAMAGALAGLAGALQVAGVYHRLIPSISSGYGYLALLVAMLAGYRVAWVPLVALFFAALNVGSVQLPLVLQLDSSLSGVLQGVLVLVALWVGARSRRRKGTA